MIEIYLIKYIMCLPFLVYASYNDIKTRTVSDFVWALMLVPIILIIEYELLTNLSVFIDISITIGIIYVIVKIMHSSGVLGGADCKLLLIFALLFHNVLFIFSVLVTSIIISVLSIPLIWVTKNDIKTFHQPFIFVLSLGLTLNIVFGDLITQLFIKLIN